MKLEFTKEYYELMEKGNLNHFIEKHGKDIHYNGTHELIVYLDERTNTSYQLRLDVLDDYTTPSYHVRGNSDDDYLEGFGTYEEAFDDFVVKVIDHEAQLQKGGLS